jgi:Domain of unknown function (DUF4440)
MAAMTKQLRILGIAATCALMAGPAFSVANAQDMPASAEQTQIVNVLKTVFVAAEGDDVAKFDSLIAPGFYIYDGGVRFDGDAIMGLVKRLHASGKTYEWSVTEPDVHVSGNTAWVAYVNKGSISDSSGTKPQAWLESAVLRKQGREWKIVFMHSTRAAVSDSATRRASAQ